MEISTDLAQTIVTEMKEIIGQNINYINTDGFIIASTNEERIGTLHEGGKKVIETKRDLVIEYDGEFSGAKKGINLPVYFESKIVGVIGITGKREEVEGYGKIIKRMTELLIKDAYANRVISQQKETQRMIVEQLLTLTSDEERHELFKRLNISNVDTSLPRMAVVAKIDDDRIRMDRTEQIFQIFNERLVKYFDNFIAQINNNIVILLRELSQEELNQILFDIINEVKNKLNLNIKVGVGTAVRDILHVKKSYEEACIAQSWAIVSKDKNTMYYNDLGIELILEEVSKKTSDKFIHKVIGSLEHKDIKEYEEIISLFDKYNGSIKRISELLFIHKNTLQYKLNRLYEKTGYDMRNYRDLLMLKIAFLLYKSRK
ncbi:MULTISPECIES: CdaR family transcriptional regulator [Siminovitchia]|uniref:CdaR family transcriptional regulator n=1 Tax=Siminovitchia TaxID=2837510 RepID=UPI0011A37BD8|nr:sugar diacid recognition domain-containing protein [Siminovitchia fortis]